jgi:hypothetical protein
MDCENQPISEVLYNQTLELYNRLVELGVPENYYSRRDIHKETALSGALENLSHDIIIEKLIKAGCNVNCIRDSDLHIPFYNFLMDNRFHKDPVWIERLRKICKLMQDNGLDSEVGYEELLPYSNVVKSSGYE